MQTSKQTNIIINNVNKALRPFLENCDELTTLHDLIYSAAATIIELHQQKLPAECSSHKKKSYQLGWEVRQKKIWRSQKRHRSFNAI